MKNYTKEQAIMAINNGDIEFWELDTTLKHDRAFVLECISTCSVILRDIPEEFLSDKEIVLARFRIAGDEFKYISEDLKNDEEIFKQAILADYWKCCDGYDLHMFENYFPNNKTLFLEALEYHGKKVGGGLLKFASEELRDDKEVVLAAFKYGWYYCEDEVSPLIKFASERLQNDREVVLAAVRECVWALDELKNKYRNDKEVVIAAVSRDAFALDYANDKFKADKDVVLAAIKKSPIAIEFASQELQNDPDIIAAAKR